MVTCDTVECGSEAIYRHLPGKDAVLTGLVESVFARMRVPARRGVWQDRVRDFARAYRDLARAHPTFPLYLVSDAKLAAAATCKRPRCLRRRGCGHEGSRGWRIWWSTTSTGSRLPSRPLGQPDNRRELLAQLEERRAGEFPTMRRIFEGLSGEDLAVDFEFGLDAIVAGLAVMADRGCNVEKGS